MSTIVLVENGGIIDGHVRRGKEVGHEIHRCSKCHAPMQRRRDKMVCPRCDK